MALPLTNDEKRTIILMHEQNCSIKEIQEKIGRSRESILKVLTDAGLYEIGIFDEAERRARIKQYNWRELSPMERSSLVEYEIIKIKEECKAYYKLLFALDITDHTNYTNYIRVSDVLNYCDNKVKELEKLQDKNQQMLREAKDASTMAYCANTDNYFRQQISVYSNEIPRLIKMIQRGEDNDDKTSDT